MDTRCNGKGHHPSARPYNRHPLYRMKRQIMQNLLPFARRLAIMRLGMNLVGTTEGKAAPLFVDADLMVLTDGMVGDTSYKWYVDTDGYSMLQANEAEPPPADGCMNASDVSVGETSKKPIFGVLAPLRRIAAALMVFVSLLTMAASCNKNPEPQPEPTKNITLTWDIEEGWDNIHMDTIKKYADQPDVKTVDLHLKDCYYKTSGFTPDVFHRICDSVEKRFKYSDKVKGSGTIFVSRLNGAQLPDVNSGLTGMAEVDSIRFSRMGYNIARFNPYRH